MATADKLKKYVTSIADAIRKKEGSTELINPQDFAERIDALQIGGGSAEGGNAYEYIDVRGINEWQRLAFGAFSCLVRIEDEQFSGVAIAPLSAFAMEVEISPLGSVITALAMDLDITVRMEGNEYTIGQFFQAQGVDLSSLPRLTKEQFYTLE